LQLSTVVHCWITTIGFGDFRLFWKVPITFNLHRNGTTSSESLPETILNSKVWSIFTHANTSLTDFYSSVTVQNTNINTHKNFKLMIVGTYILIHIEWLLRIASELRCVVSTISFNFWLPAMKLYCSIEGLYIIVVSSTVVFINNYKWLNATYSKIIIIPIMKMPCNVT